MRMTTFMPANCMVRALTVKLILLRINYIHTYIVPPKLLGRFKKTFDSGSLSVPLQISPLSLINIPHQTPRMEPEYILPMDSNQSQNQYKKQNKIHLKVVLWRSICQNFYKLKVFPFFNHFTLKSTLIKIKSIETWIYSHHTISKTTKLI